MHMTTKPDRDVTYSRRIPPAKSYNLLITWSHEKLYDCISTIPIVSNLAE